MPHQTDAIRILLVDDHAIVRQGLQMFIDGEPGFRVIGMTGARTTALELATREQPDVILLDLDLGHDSGLELLPDLRAAAPQARVILLTGARDPEQHLRAVQRGAMGVVLKDQATESLMAAIKSVHAGGAWLDPTLTLRLLSQQNRPQPPHDPEADKIAALTERERAIVALICEGLQNTDISARLHISAITVRNHLSAIFGKLGVTGRLELAIYAFRHGLVTPPQKDR
ncbi:MAG: response regulator transcription factor [Chloroflexota bacterium]|nr:response regulator transcription factor [Chloroflexota bacterium]